MNTPGADLTEVDPLLTQVLALPSSVYRYDHNLRLAHRYMEQSLPKSALPLVLAALELNQTTACEFLLRLLGVHGSLST